MEKLLEEFKAAIQKENEVLDQLASLGEEKQRHIVLGQLKELDGLMQREGLVVANLEKLEGTRFKLQQQINQKWGRQDSQPGASELLSRVQTETPDLYAGLEEQIHRLAYNLSRLKAINSHNHELLEQSLGYIDTLEALLEGDIAGTYSDKGQQVDEDRARPRINLLDKKV